MTIYCHRFHHSLVFKIQAANVTFRVALFELVAILRDTGIVASIHQNGKTAAQCTVAASKANQVLGMIRRNIKWKNKEVIVRLYKALVRPRIEYCVQAWSPNLEKDKMLIEKVQRRATKMIKGFGKLSYDERLRRTGLTTLEERRIRGDLIETFKMIKGISKVDYTKIFSISENNRTRGNFRE